MLKQKLITNTYKRFSSEWMSEMNLIYVKVVSFILFVSFVS